MKEELKDFIRKFNTVPPSHHVLARLRQAIADENSDLDDIAAIIKVDSSLATSVMRLSNSAYFGTPTQTDSIEEAISLLGSREVYKLAAIVAILDMMNSRKSAYPLSSEEIWRTTVLTAIIMERFARIASLDGHTAYTVGLVHSVGKWILNQFMEVYSVEIDYGVKKDYASLARWERDTFDTDHAEVGGEVLIKWDFTSDLSQPVLYQLDRLAITLVRKRAYGLPAAIQHLRSGLCGSPPDRERQRERQWKSQPESAAGSNGKCRLERLRHGRSPALGAGRTGPGL